MLKEQGGNGRFITTGVRWAESSRRKRDRGVFEAYTRNKENKIVLKGEEQEPSKIFEGCKVAAKRVVNPIVDWTDNQVWSFLQDAKVPVNPLYECGKIMWDVQPTKRYCDSCIRKRNIKSAQASYQRRRDAGVLKKRKKTAAHPCLKKTIKPIEQCTREAAALGLTYWQYVARGLDKE